MPRAPLTAPQRSQRARLAALTRWSREPLDPGRHGRGQQGLRDRLARDLAAAGHLPADLAESERQQRIDRAVHAHMLRLALASSRAAAARRAAKQNSETAS